MGPETTESVPAADGGAAVAIAAIFLLLGLAAAIASCPGAAGGADAPPG